MTKLNQVYKCEVCGNIVEVLHTGGGELVCCNQPMNLLEANTTDAATEKHVPVIEKSGDTVTVKVGSVDHPMLNEHYIEFIELIADGQVLVNGKVETRKRKKIVSGDIVEFGEEEIRVQLK